jgi:hypothetical protein
MIKRSIAAALAAATFAGAAYAQTALGPSMTSVAVTSGLMNALPANPGRKGVVICNESTSGTATVTTGPLSPVSLTTGRVLASGNLVTSCLTIGSTQGVSNSGVNVGAQINVAVSANPTSITFIEYY